MKRPDFVTNPWLAIRTARRLPPHSQGWADCNREARDAGRFVGGFALIAIVFALGIVSGIAAVKMGWVA